MKTYKNFCIYLSEKWSDKYKKSIDCNNPKGFSQRAHCQGKKKLKEDTSSVVDEFLKSTGQKFSKRDTCGPACIDFISWAKREKGIDLSRVRGEFVADEVVHDKADFTSQMKQEFMESGLNWNSAKDRKKWIEKSKYAQEWKRVPHYWTVDKKGNIHDPSGYQQLVATGLAKNLNPSRYIPEEKKKLKEDTSIVNDQDLKDVGEWLDTSVDNIKVELKREPISKFEKQIKEMYSTYDEFPKDEKRTNKILNQLKRGGEALPIYVEKNDKNLFVMEGRHRMVAFWLHKMKEIPVAYVSKKN